MRTGADGNLRSLDKAISILELLSTERQGLPLSEIARRLKFNDSTTHHVLATLRQRGFIEQDPQSRAYRLGYSLVRLVLRFLSETDLYSAGAGPVQQLRDASGETSYLTTLHNDDLVSIIEMLGSRPIQARRTRVPGQPCLHSTASGKTFLAYMSPPEREALVASLPLTHFTSHTIVDRDALRAELDHIRRQGYALDQEENIAGVMCIAAPVFAAGGDCVATVSVALPAAQQVRMAELTPLVTDAAITISVNLGHVPTERASQVLSATSD